MSGAGKRRTQRTSHSFGARKALRHGLVAPTDLAAANGLVKAKLSVIGHLFAGEEGVRSPVHRDDALRNDDGYGQFVFMLSHRLSHQIRVARLETRTANQQVASK